MLLYVLARLWGEPRAALVSHRAADDTLGLKNSYSNDSGGNKKF